MFLLFTQRFQALINPPTHFWRYLFQSANCSANLSCSEIRISQRETQIQFIVFGTSAVFRLRNFPFGKLPFAPDLNLSNYGPKSYFRPFISYLIGLKLADFQTVSNFSTKNFPTIFPQRKQGKNTSYSPFFIELYTLFRIFF